MSRSLVVMLSCAALASCTVDWCEKYEYGSNGEVLGCEVTETADTAAPTTETTPVGDADTDADSDSDTDSDADTDTGPTEVPIIMTGDTGGGDTGDTAGPGPVGPTCGVAPGAGQACVCLKADELFVSGEVTWYINTLGIGESTFWTPGGMAFATAPVEDYACGLVAYSNGGMLIDGVWNSCPDTGDTGQGCAQFLYRDTGHIGFFGYYEDLSEVVVDGVFQDLSGCWGTGVDGSVGHNYIECPAW